MKPLHRRVRFAATVCFVVLLPGCATAARAPLARRTEGLPSHNRGQSAAAVFSGPEVAWAMSDTPEWVRPEYARNDGALALREPRALTAIDEWPQPAPPSIERQRRTTISRSPETIIFFAPPRHAAPRPHHRPHAPDAGRRQYPQQYR